MDTRAESAMETRCRVSLMLRGLPRPELQYQVRDEIGDHVAWLDMAYPAARAGVEFDGEYHQDAPVFRADLARHNRLTALGWTVLRASATDVLRNPDAFATQVRSCSANTPPDSLLCTSRTRLEGSSCDAQQLRCRVREPGSGRCGVNWSQWAVQKTLRPYISPSGSAISSTRAPSGSRK
jgi:very-short-patch-repair endonuclease